MPVLRILEDGTRARELHWKRGCVGIGRNPLNQVVIDHKAVSPWQAVIYDEGEGQFRLRRLCGARGVSLEGNRIVSHWLADGDVFSVGPARIGFVNPSAGDADCNRPLALREFPDEIPDSSGWFPWPAGEGDDSGVFSIRGLLDACGTIGRRLDGSQMLRTVLERVMENASPSRCFVAWVDEDGEGLEVCGAHGAPRGASASADMNGSVVSQALRTHRPSFCGHLLERPELGASEAASAGIHSALCAPFESEGRVAAFLYADWREETAVPTVRELDWIAALARYVAIDFPHRVEHQRLRQEYIRSQSRQGSGTTFVGISRATERLLEMSDRCAAADVDVLITGETGTGKELLARRIHQLSRRADRAFVAVNCSAIPTELFESEVFGHARGAFTGSIASHAGRFEEADGGTIFLDEIGEMSLAHQAKLLRVLEERSVTPVGGHTRSVNVRVIAASNRDLGEAVRGGGMRSDFRQRLGVPIETTPLRSRREDIPALAYYLLDRLAPRLDKSVSCIAPAAMGRLVNYDWPGNARELRNALRNALLLCGDRIEVADLQLDPNLTASAAGALRNLAQVEKAHVERVLGATRGHQGQAARILGVSENTVTALMGRHGITRRQFRK